MWWKRVQIQSGADLGVVHEKTTREFTMKLFCFFWKGEKFL